MVPNSKVLDDDYFFDKMNKYYEFFLSRFQMNISYGRFLELAGIPFLVEAMTPREAKQIFKFYGANDADLELSNLKKARNKLIKSHHPDKDGGDLKAAQEINAAYDVLKTGQKDQERTSRDYWRGTRKPQDEGTPVWAWAGYSGGSSPNSNISRENYTDLNYCKKHLWELSGKSTEVWTLWAFDGSFFRGVFSTYGSHKIIKDMAEAMVIWNDTQYKTRAVFAARKSEPDLLFCVYADGKYYSYDPPAIIHDSFNANPGNDQQFVRKLPNTLDRLQELYPHAS